MNKCTSCLIEYEKNFSGKINSNGTNEFFYKNGKKGVFATLCYQCYRSKINKKWSLIKPINKRYEKTKKGFIMRMYRNMFSRISGVQKLKKHLYSGKSLMCKKDFYNFAENSNEFSVLFDAYKKSGFDRKMAPTPDRIDSSKGYEIWNIEWVTHSENSRRGSILKWNKRRNNSIKL